MYSCVKPRANNCCTINSFLWSFQNVALPVASCLSCSANGADIEPDDPPDPDDNCNWGADGKAYWGICIDPADCKAYCGICIDPDDCPPC